MKNLALLSLFLIPFLFSFTPKQAAKEQKKGKVVISWVFVGVLDGYDHDTKCKVWIDDEYMGESTVKKESKANSITVETTLGKHTVKIMNFADYEGKWEEHTKDNNYSLDASFEDEVKIKKKTQIKLTFSITDESTEVKIK